MNYKVQNLFISTPDASSTSDTKSVLFHQVYYLGETIIQRYKGPTQRSQVYIPIITRIHPTIQAGNTLNLEENYLSKYPLNFIGCYY